MRRWHAHTLLPAVGRLAVYFACVAAASLAQAAAPMGYDDARHLLARTGFGPTEAEVRAHGRADPRRGRRTGVARRPHGAHDAATRLDRSKTARCARAGDPGHRRRNARRSSRSSSGAASSCAAWWVQEMLSTPSPLTERMTLFWHNHFVSSQQKVRLARAHVPAERDAARQCARQLRHAAARGVEGSRDAHLPRRRAEPQGPAEREFRARSDGALHARRGPLLGAGRQGSGARVHRLEPRARHRPSTCSARASTTTASKTVLGRTGHFDGDAVLDILLARPADRRASSPPSCGASSCRPIPIRAR